MGSKSKRKGKSGEAEACKIFAEVFGGSWIRVPNSGAYVGGQNKVRKILLSSGQVKAFKGDIIPPDEFNIALEVKNYADFPFHQLLADKDIGLLETWLDEIYDAIDENDFWLLCMKFNNKGWFVLFDSTIEPLQYRNHSVYNSIKRQKKYIVVADLKEFLLSNKVCITARCSSNAN